MKLSLVNTWMVAAAVILELRSRNEVTKARVWVYVFKDSQGSSVFHVINFQTAAILRQHPGDCTIDNAPPAFFNDCIPEDYHALFLPHPFVFQQKEAFFRHLPSAFSSQKFCFQKKKTALFNNFRKNSEIFFRVDDTAANQRIVINGLAQYWQ
ncbi:MAG TPA: hypothetical protein VJ969_11245 [Desulfopila sp.]|nr:hypothetical protein [Desulfopila sp.]